MEHRNTHITPSLHQSVIESNTLIPALISNVLVPLVAAQIHAIPIKVGKLSEWQLVNAL